MLQGKQALSTYLHQYYTKQNKTLQDIFYFILFIIVYFFKIIIILALFMV
ncbi:hypothetical protein SAG0137_02305 [Streptococcus agalactiae LMG 14838]|nr:hypothetical protein SAG0137_02305 [Streptococcus agalactiae LMG 14838]